MAKLAEDTAPPCVNLSLVAHCSSVMVAAVKRAKGHLASLAAHDLDVRWYLESLLRVVAATAIFAGTPHEQLTRLKLVALPRASGQQRDSLFNHLVSLRHLLMFDSICH